MIHIRQATVEDAELLARLVEPVHTLHVQAQPHLFKPYALTPEWIADYRERLEDESNFTFIGEIDGEAVGHILTQVIDRPDNPYTYALRFLLVDQMSISPAHLRMGYGTALMNAAFDLAKAQGCTSMILNVWSFNERAIAFYQRQGFNVRDLRMEARLE
jgi:ribosomal protein S18 acetylase RimI-like enzyme